MVSSTGWQGIFAVALAAPLPHPSSPPQSCPCSFSLLFSTLYELPCSILLFHKYSSAEASRAWLLGSTVTCSVSIWSQLYPTCPNPPVSLPPSSPSCQKPQYLTLSLRKMGITTPKPLSGVFALPHTGEIWHEPCYHHRSIQYSCCK